MPDEDVGFRLELTGETTNFGLNARIIDGTNKITMLFKSDGCIPDTVCPICGYFGGLFPGKIAKIPGGLSIGSVGCKNCKSFFDVRSSEVTMSKFVARLYGVKAK